jgi:hypothetical protein
VQIEKEEEEEEIINLATIYVVKEIGGSECTSYRMYFLLLFAIEK